MRKCFRLIAQAGRKVVTNPGDAWLMLRMAWWVVVLSVTARCFSLPRALQIVAGPQHGPKRSGILSQTDLARTIDLLLATDVFVFRPICWKRAAVLHRYLAHNGITTRIVFGVRNESAGKVDGHAWLEVNGEPILESTPPEYVVTYRFPSSDRFDPRLASITAE